MAFGINAYAETPFGAEPSDVVVHLTGISLTSTIGEESNIADANVSVTGIQATLTNAGAVAGSSALVTTTGISLTSSIGEEEINIGQTVTGQELSISNLTFTQDTLTAFGQAPFATQSPSQFKIPSVTIETTTGAGELPSFLLQSTLGTFSVSADGNVSVVVTEHTMNTSIGTVSIEANADIEIFNGTGPEFSALGNAALSTDQAKFGASSLELDGTDDFVDSTSNINLSSTDFTIDVWIRPNSVSGYKGIWESGTSTKLVSYLLGNTVYLTVGGSTIISNSVTVNANEWTMLSYERQGNTHRVYKNGTLEDTGSTANRPDNGIFSIGESGFGDFNGYIDEFRISNIVRYGASFTEPTSAFSVDSDTIALLHFDGADGSTDMINALNAEALVLTSNQGTAIGEARTTVQVTGQQLTMTLGEESTQADATVSVTGISLTSSIGSAEQNTIYSVTGISMTMSMGEETTTGDANITPTGIQLQSNTGNPNITAWQEIDPGVNNTWTEVSTGVSNTWTEVDKAA